MKTLEEIKNEVSVKHGFDSWEYVIDSFIGGDLQISNFMILENEAMKLYAEQIAIKACKIQKVNCVGEFVGSDLNDIMNAPQPNIKQLMK